MTKENLSSDRINYLIWRYLQESDYRETALKLQKEWNVEDPQLFDFAPHVKDYALVAVLQRGLLYNDSERKSIEVRRDVTAPLPGFFGPLTPQSPAPGVDGDDYENVRKREADPRQNHVRIGSPAKRVKLSNGHENGIDPMSMDIDEIRNGNGHAYPSPKEVEQPPTPVVVTDGPEKSTQIEKVAELYSETTYLTLTDPENPEVKPLVLFCAWNPQDPTVLAGAGTDKLARLWTISRAAAPELQGHVNGSKALYQDIVDRNSGTGTTDGNPTITALSWSSDGTAIALASESEDEYGLSERDSAKVSIWGVDGTMIMEFLGFEPPIYCIQWNPQNTVLLALVPDANSTTITIFSISTQRVVTHPFAEYHQDMPPLEAVWTGDQEFLVCGGDLLVTFTWADGTINRLRKFETREDHQLAKATYDRHSRLLATATETGIIDIWDHLGQCNSRSAHQGQITSLLWQPLPNHVELDNISERFLASSGDDGIISIWSSRAESKPRCSMTLGDSVVALAFTPDGAFLASATVQQILIWRLEDVSIPRARWALGPGSSNAWTASEDGHHTLSWDASGHKLAYGVDNILAVIEWRPSTNGVGN